MKLELNGSRIQHIMSWLQVRRRYWNTISWASYSEYFWRKCKIL